MEFPKIEIRNILYATDDSEDARYAFNYAVHFSKQFDAKLTLLHVVPEFPDMVAFDFGIERSVAATKWFSIKKDYVQKVRDKFLEMVKIKFGEELMDNIEIAVEKGNPVKTILRVAADRKSDLIVMGIKGKGTLEDAMMGDTVGGVLRRSKVPVLVLRHSENK